MIAELRRCDVYVFGSVLDANTGVSDVDVLVVYHASDDVASIREAITPLTFRFPLDVTYMSESEESEFEFIRDQNAIRLSEITERRDRAYF